MAKKNFYAVRVGKVPGIYKTWPECQANTSGFPGAVFKGFAGKAFLICLFKAAGLACFIFPSSFL